MKIDIEYVFRPGEEAHRPDALDLVGGWPAPNLSVLPIQGDLISFGDGDDVTVFEVVNRLFIWKTSEHLVIRPLLGLLPN